MTDADEWADALELPDEMLRAPAWARSLYKQVRAHRHEVSNKLMAVSSEIGGVSGEVQGIKLTLGKEPDSDGKGGAGVIGDLRKTSGEVAELKSLKTMGVGFMGALTIFGGLIFAGVGEWVRNAITNGGS